MVRSVMSMVEIEPFEILLGIRWLCQGMGVAMHLPGVFERGGKSDWAGWEGATLSHVRSCSSARKEQLYMESRRCFDKIVVAVDGRLSEISTI